MSMRINKKKAFLRGVLRGYRYLKNSGRLHQISTLKECLTAQNPGTRQEEVSINVFGAKGIKFSEIIIKQYLLYKFGGSGFNKALLYSVGKGDNGIIYPLPKFWRQTIEAHNFRVSNFWCATLWQLKIFMYFGFGVLQIIKTTFFGFHLLSSKRSSKNFAKYVYFDNLSESNLPVMGGRNQNIFSWYSQWSGRKENSQIFRHNINAQKSKLTIKNVTIEFQQSPIPSLVGVTLRLKYLLWGLRASLIAFLDMFRGRWWHALLLNQAAIMSQVTHTKSNLLASEYLFHNSDWIYRPLWTYEAERCGSTITFYFYSTNCESFKRSNDYPPISYGWSAMCWPHYLVWNDYQADFVRRAVGAHANITIVGPIWFSSSHSEMTSLPPKTIAVFDVQPFRNFLYSSLALEFDYYIPSISQKFLNDINEAIVKNDLTLALKRKREIGKLSHPLYRKNITKLRECKNFISIDPDIDAWQLIANSIAVISMPFTSTALIARDMGKPSIYYDPMGILIRDDRAAHGIPIISGIEELCAWVSILAEKK